MRAHIAVHQYRCPTTVDYYFFLTKDMKNRNVEIAQNFAIFPLPNTYYTCMRDYYENGVY